MDKEKSNSRNIRNISVHQLIKQIRYKKNFYKATREIRAQLGLKDRFKAGIERSGLYMTEILKILKANNLPGELSVLSHVESSFQLFQCWRCRYLAVHTQYGQVIYESRLRCR